MRLKSLLVVIALATIANAQDATKPKADWGADEKPRVFVTDSQSWEMQGGGGGSSSGFGGGSSGGARPQTAEIIKTFGERCPQAMVNNKKERANYIVVLDHEGGKGWLKHKNKVAVFEAQSGDTVVSHSTLSLGGSVQEACDAITKHWTDHGKELRAASAPQATTAAPAVASVAPEMKANSPRISVESTPGGADIEIDGNFVGSTPSAIELASGDHTIVVKKSGYKDWQRKMKLSAGDIKVSAELEKSESK
jgi:hypothetical protein